MIVIWYQVKDNPSELDLSAFSSFKDPLNKGPFINYHLGRVGKLAAGICLKKVIFPNRGDHNIKYLFDRGDRKISGVKIPRFFSPPLP